MIIAQAYLVRAAIGAAISVAMLIGVGVLYKRWISSVEARGYNLAIAEVEAKTKEINDAQREVEKIARRAQATNQEHIDALQKNNLSDRAALAAARERLRSTTQSLAASSAPGACTTTITIFNATRIADVLSECGAENERLAAEADRLAIKVTGLQGYIRDVVLPVAGDEP